MSSLLYSRQIMSAFLRNAILLICLAALSFVELSRCNSFLFKESVAFEAQQASNDGRGSLSAGAFARNIDPIQLPVWVNGGIAGRKLDRIADPLHARSLVLGDETTQIAICIVDNCILPIDLVDRAKELTQQKTGIAFDRIMISATHAHSAVSVSGAHGTPVQEDYAAELPNWIADSIAQAQSRMVPAKWGTTDVRCDKYIYCRDWLMKPGTANSSPFSGRANDLVSMNPGHANPNKLAPIGPVDHLVPVLSIQDLNGKAISVLATFCTHYASAPHISADYFAVVCNRLEKALSPESPNSFVGIMSNSTSGNANCVDFSSPKESFTHHDVGNYVADRILSVIGKVEYSPNITLDAELKKLDLEVRMPSATEVATAQRYMETHFPDRLPTTMDENYARETVLLSQLPATRTVNLQAFRLNDFVITANPCEAYNETGLKIRQASPFRLTMNVGLANGHAGYLPPPEMFQLGGYTTWRCRTSCLEEQAEPKVVHGLTDVMHALHSRRTNVKPVAVHEGVQEQGNQKTDDTLSSNLRKGPHSPVSPSESLQWLETDPDFEITLVASEPQVVDPISIQIDENGRMWVVEMRDYPTSDLNGKSRIVILEDKDLNGFFETSHVFADNLLFATGVQPWRDGALVTVEGKLLMLHDTDGDLRADITQELLTGFATDNPQLRANHPTIAPDGYLYIANGLRGGKIAQLLPTSERKSEPLDITGSDLRINLFTGQMECIAGPTQFGLSFDKYGHRYGCSNRQPCFEILSERRNLNVSPLSGLSRAWHEVSPGEAASKVFPLVNAWTTSNLHAGQFSAACGVLVTHSQHFKQTPFATVLTCEPTGGLVQRRSIERVDGRSKAIDESSKREWIASHDPWFRPVDLYEGPNGDIFVVDMYRAVIEHPEWVPEELKNRPDAKFGDSHGRIYRVTAKPSSTEIKRHTAPSKTISIVDRLVSDCSWDRSIGVRKFCELLSTQLKSGGTADTPRTTNKSLDDETAASIAELKKMISTTGTSISADALATIFMLLNSCDLLTTSEMEHFLVHVDSNIRSMGWRGLQQSRSSIPDKWLQYAWSTLASSNASIEEQREVAWFLAGADKTKTRDVKNLTAAANAIARHDNDPHLWMAIAAVCRDDVFRWIDCYSNALLSFSREDNPSSTGDMLSSSSNTVAQQSIWRLVKNSAKEMTTSEIQEQLDRWILACYQENPVALRRLGYMVLEGIQKSGKLFISPGSAFEKSVLKAVSSETDFVCQQSAIGLLGACRSEDAKQIALDLLESTNVETVKRAIEAASAQNTPALSEWLCNHLLSALPEVRQSIFISILSDTTRLSDFIDRLESGEISVKLLDAVQLQTLRSIKDTDLATRIAKQLASSIDTNRQKVIDEYAMRIANIEVHEARSKGKAIFEKNCSACHRLNGVGNVVGPDISDSRIQSFEKLLIAILDPNRSIDANFFRYIVQMEDGSVLEGLMKDVNSKTITLQNQSGSKTVSRSEIAEMKGTGMSLMPEGIEVQIPAEDMADLLWYIKNWRYVADNIPANASIKLLDNN